MRSAAFLVVAVGFASTVHAQAPAREKVFVPPVQAKGLSAEVREALFDLVIVSVSRAKTFDVVTAEDVQAQIQHERLKDAIGCTAVACATELAGALGVRYLLATRVKKLGGQLQVTASLIDTREQRSQSGMGSCPDKEAEYSKAVEAAIAEALGVVTRDLVAAPGPGPSAVAGGSPASSLGCPAGMAAIPGGSFFMGAPEGLGEFYERPQHRVTLSAYCIDVTEVTVAAYGACVAAGACPPAVATVNHYWDPNPSPAEANADCNAGRADRERHPINCVDYPQAAAYCTWVGGRLPTEAEWEYAGHGTQAGAYVWGDEPPGGATWNGCDESCAKLPSARLYKWANHAGNDGWATTAPVGTFPRDRSVFGVLDLEGNVREWVGDWHTAYTADAVTNPDPANVDGTRVLRGSGWAQAKPARVTYRWGVGPTGREADLGFRCARGAKAP